MITNEMKQEYIEVQSKAIELAKKLNPGNGEMPTRGMIETVISLMEKTLEIIGSLETKEDLIELYQISFEALSVEDLKTLVLGQNTENAIEQLKEVLENMD